jgi:hypothetical protein
VEEKHYILEPDLWTASKLIAAPATDGGKSRIPILKIKAGDREEAASTNGEKSTTLAKCFFPPKPREDSIPQGFKYPQQCQGKTKITTEQISSQTRKLKPYKAPGPDGI